MLNAPFLSFVDAAWGTDLEAPVSGGGGGDDDDEESSSEESSSEESSSEESSEESSSIHSSGKIICVCLFNAYHLYKAKHTSLISFKLGM